MNLEIEGCRSYRKPSCQCSTCYLTEAMIFASGNGSHIEHGVPRGIDELVIPPTMQIIESLLKLARTNRCPSNANDPELPIRTLAETARRLGCNVNGYVVVNNQLIDGSLLAGG